MNFTYPFGTKFQLLKFLIEAHSFLTELDSLDNITTQVGKDLNTYIWLKNSISFYVNSITGIDDEDSERGKSLSLPFKTLQFALNFVSEKYNLSNYACNIYLADGSYALNDKTIFPAYTSTTGSISIRSLSGNKKNVKLGRCLVKSSDYRFYNITFAPLNNSSIDEFNVIDISGNGTACHLDNCEYVLENISNPNICVIKTRDGASSTLRGKQTHNIFISNSPNINCIFSSLLNSSANIIQNVDIFSTSVNMNAFVISSYNSTLLSYKHADSGLNVHPVYKTYNYTDKQENAGLFQGKRFLVNLNSIINIDTTPNNLNEFFPGSLPGLVESGGIYIAY
jgi:hypothetical protein